MYKVVKGKTVEEALASSPFKVGDLVRVVGLRVHANSVQPGTWCVFPEFEIITEKEQNRAQQSSTKS